MKCQLTKLCKFVSKATESLKDIPLLAMRLVLAYGFWGPATMKWNDINAIGDWFGSMGMPFPLVNAYMAGITEMGGVFLLILGFGTRLISIPLIVTMLVAIFMVHSGNGFEAGKNGFEIPLYYLIMLFTLTVYGPGRLSVDNLIKTLRKK